MEINFSERLVFASHSSTHHASHSGYAKLTEQFPGSTVVTGKNGIPFRLSKVLSSFVSNDSGIYNHLSVNKELVLSNLMLKNSNGVCHFLNAERDIFLSPYFRKIRNWNMVGTFHKPPSQLSRIFTNRKYIGNLDGAVAVGTNQLDWIHTLIKPENVRFIPHGVDTEFFSPVETGWRNQIIFVGQHLRNFELLQNTFNIIKRRFPKLILVAVVRKEFVDKLPKDNNVKIYSSIGDDKLRELYRRSAFLLLPLIDSTACNSILEAMACGLPIITNDVGGVKDYLGPEAGYLLRSNPTDMSEAAIHLLENVEENLKIRSKARIHSLEFSWDKVGQIMSNYYKSFTN